MRLSTVATAATLAAIGGLHVAWGLGSSFPFRDHTTLADTVAGTQAVPKRAECFAVAGLLTAAATLVAGERMVPARLRRTGALGVGLVLGVRGMAGVTGNTHRLVGWDTSPTFVEHDRRYYGPLCLLLATGTLRSVCASDHGL
jgi:hypothetical protein